MPDEVRKRGPPLGGAGRRPWPGAVSRQRSRPGSLALPHRALRRGSSEDHQQVARPRRSRRPPPSIRVTVPARGARSSFCIFMASTTSRACPASTTSSTVTRDLHDPPRDDGTDLERPTGRGRARPVAAGPLAQARPGPASSTMRLVAPAVDDDLDAGGDHRGPAAPTAADRRAWRIGELGRVGLRRGRVHRSVGSSPMTVTRREAGGSSRPPIVRVVAAAGAPPARRCPCAKTPSHRRRTWHRRTCRRRIRVGRGGGRRRGCATRSRCARLRRPRRPNGARRGRSTASAVAERRRAQQRAMERQGGLDPGHDDFVERPRHARDGRRPIRSDGQDLGDHRIVVGRDPLPRPDRAVDADARDRPA